MFSIEQLNVIRNAEMEVILKNFYPAGAHILEIGAGNGKQAAEIAAAGFRVDAIDVEDSNYSGHRIYNIKNYDGNKIPYDNDMFDIVFSSNVLEHIKNLESMHLEIIRVLKPEGYVVHVLPTHTWRFWSTLAAFIDSYQRSYLLVCESNVRPELTRENIRRVFQLLLRLVSTFISPFLQKRHGERGNIFTEFFYFHPNWWRRNFNLNGFVVESDFSMNLFYTGSMILGKSLTVKQRERLSSFLGNACHLYKLRPVAHQYQSNKNDE